MRYSLPAIWSFSLILLLSLLVASADTPEPTKPCFQCAGTGLMKCPAPTCVKGRVVCPGPCLKLAKGNWHHQHVDGHPDTDLWITFHNSNHTSSSWNQNHVGDVIQIQNGMAVDIGKCPICHGSGRATCKLCQGTDEVPCTVCDGHKVVPFSWTAFDNPKLKDRPEKFTLKDGTVIIGRSIIVSSTTTTIRTEKDKVEVKTTDIASETKQPTAK